MSIWKELCEMYDVNAYYLPVSKDEFDKLRAVVEAADKYADEHGGPKGYVNWQVLCKALDELGVGE